jgi:hypothetical protein
VLNIKSGVVECEAALNDVDTEITSLSLLVLSDIVDAGPLDRFKFPGCKGVGVFICDVAQG